MLIDQKAVVGDSMVVSFCVWLLEMLCSREGTPKRYLFDTLTSYDFSVRIPPQYKLAFFAALVASASAFAPTTTMTKFESSTALFNEKADWEKAAELGWSMGGEDYTRNVTPQKNEDPRKNIEEGPSFEEYMKQRAAGGGQ